MKNYITLLLLLWAIQVQSAEQIIKVIVAPDSKNWTYEPGKKVTFNVTVIHNSIPIEEVEIRYELSNDMMPPFKEEKLILKNGKTSINAGTMKTAGFIRCRVFAKYQGNEYEGRATAGFAPETIVPTTQTPDDFVAYWNEAKMENSKIPLDARLTLLSDRCTSKTNVYEVNIQNYEYGCRLYGILCVPKANGKYPALLRLPGAGVGSFNGDISTADKGLITLEIGIHGIPVTMENKIYGNLAKGVLNGYQYSNWDDKDKVYYKRVYMGCVRAIDYIFSMQEFDGSNIVVLGGSQGAALAMVTTALDERVKGVVAFYPALCDLTGYYYNRAGGWPHLFKNKNENDCIIKQKVANSQYYDVVNFAKQIKVPGYYSFGYNDMVCPPTSMFSAYNVIASPKILNLIPETAHFGYSEQWIEAMKWAMKMLNKDSSQ